MSSVIVVEERLRTRSVTLAIAAVGLLLTTVEVWVMSMASSHIPWVAVGIVGVVLAVMVVILIGSVKVIVRVLDGPSGRTLEVLYGPGPVFRQQFTPDEIVGASAHQLSFVQMGGWGYRGSLRFFKYAALVTRRGDALMVILTGARRFVVTVDEPKAFAEALNAGRSG